MRGQKGDTGVQTPDRCCCVVKAGNRRVRLPVPHLGSEERSSARGQYAHPFPCGPRVEARRHWLGGQAGCAHHRAHRAHVTEQAKPAERRSATCLDMPARPGYSTGRCGIEKMPVPLKELYKAHTGAVWAFSRWIH